MSSPSRSATDQVAQRELVLVGEQRVVHLPERALARGRLGRLGGELGVRVDVVERQVAPDVAQLAEVRQQLADHRLGLAAVRALEVAVLEQRHRGVLGPADVVALGVDGYREVDDRLGAADSARSRSGLGSSAVDAGARAQLTSGAPISRGQHAELGLGERRWPWKASVAIRSETVKPMPAIAPPPSTDAQPTGGRIRPRLSLVTSRGRAGDAHRLADQVGDDDPERDRRAVGADRKPPLITMPALASANSGTIT